jgi:AcrR family transcriptional regulator
MARRNDHSREQLKEMALLASESIIVTEGVGGLSTRKVASEIGYSAGTLYQVFKNLDDLILQLNSRTLGRLQLQMTQKQRHDAKTRLKQYGYCYVNFAYQQTELWHLLFEHRAVSSEQRTQQLLNNIDALFNMVKQALIELKPASSEIDITVAANSLWSGIHGITVLMLKGKLFDGDLLAAEHAIDCLMSNFILGWTNQGEHHA